MRLMHATDEPNLKNAFRSGPRAITLCGEEVEWRRDKRTALSVADRYSATNAVTRWDWDKPLVEEVYGPYKCTACDALITLRVLEGGQKYNYWDGWKNR